MKKMPSSLPLEKCVLENGVELKLGDIVSLPNYTNIGYTANLEVPRILGIVTKIKYYVIRNEYHIYINDKDSYYTDDDILQVFRFNDYNMLGEVK